MLRESTVVDAEVRASLFAVQNAMNSTTVGNALLSLLDGMAEQLALAVTEGNPAKVMENRAAYSQVKQLRKALTTAASSTHWTAPADIHI